MHAGSRHFLGGGTARGLHFSESHVSPCPIVPGNGGSRPEGIAVNAVVTDHQRNAETGFGVHRFHGFRQVGG